jgi:uncharacterized membrane protein
MKSTVMIGILLIALGFVALVYEGFTYTKKEKIVDIGSIEATAETKKTIPLPPIVGGLALAAGVTLVIAGARRS